MSENPWQEVLDTVYDMGGRCEYPHERTERPLESDVNLVGRTDFSPEAIRNASLTLQKMDLSTRKVLGVAADDSQARYEMQLTGEGYNFAHDRKQEERNRRLNQSITLLTVVLAFVGMAQAMALTANVATAVTGEMAIVTTAGAGLILVVIYMTLLWAGVINSDELVV